MRADNEGGLRAQIGAVTVTEGHPRELLGEFGLPGVGAQTDALLHHAEQTVRAQVERAPDGVHVAEEWVDSDGVSEEPFPIRVRVEIRGGDVVVDLSESGAQREGTWGNAIRTATVAAVRVALTCATLPRAPTMRAPAVP